MTHANMSSYLGEQDQALALSKPHKRHSGMCPTQGMVGQHHAQAVLLEPRLQADAPLCSADEFADGSAGSRFVAPSGQWLDSPVAVLKATNGTAIASALLSLASPHYNAATGELTFQVRLIRVAGKPCTAACTQVYQD